MLLRDGLHAIIKEVEWAVRGSAARRARASALIGPGRLRCATPPPMSLEPLHRGSENRKAKV